MTGSDALAAARDTLHVVAENLLAAARYQAVGRIGLTVVPGGIATPPFGETETTVALIGGELVTRSGASERRVALTNVRAGADFLGISAGPPAGAYPPATAFEPDAPLVVEASELARLFAWYEQANAALVRFSAELAADGVSEVSAVTVWPEHLDVAIRADEVNYGGSPGDAAVAIPYLYVGPSVDLLPAEPDEFWNQPFGAATTWAETTSVDQSVAFFHRGRTAAHGLTRH